MLSFSVSGLSAQRPFRRSRSCSVAVFIIALTMTACAPQSPQRPSQRSGQTAQPDSMTLAMVELYQRLADAADVELNRYIKDHPGRWFNQEDGSWYTPGVLSQDGSPVQQSAGDNGLMTLRLVTRDLQGNLLSDVQGEYELGKCQLPSSVENIISNITLSPSKGAGESPNFTVLAPWYVAYGSKGNDAVPGYQNVTIEVYVL